MVSSLAASDCEWCPAEAGAGSGDGGSSNPLLLGASEVFFLKNFIPERRCGRVESNHHSRGDGFTGRGAHRCPASARSSAGGIRTHGLELMRLAGTAAPLPRKSGRLESNQRSPVPETGGVAELPHGQLSIESTTVESNHARPPYQSGAGPAGPSSLPCSRSGNPPSGFPPLDPRPAGVADPRRRRVRRRNCHGRSIRLTGRAPTGSSKSGSCPRSGIREATSSRRCASGNPLRGIRLANKCRASPGNRTLLHGVTARGLATSLATQSRREDSNPRSSTVGAWRSPLSYGESTLSTGIEPASPGRQPGRIPRRVREQWHDDVLSRFPSMAGEAGRPRAGFEPASPV